MEIQLTTGPYNMPSLKSVAEGLQIPVDSEALFCFGGESVSVRRVDDRVFLVGGARLSIGEAVASIRGMLQGKHARFELQPGHLDRDGKLTMRALLDILNAAVAKARSRSGVDIHDRNAFLARLTHNPETGLFDIDAGGDQLRDATDFETTEFLRDLLATDFEVGIVTVKETEEFINRVRSGETVALVLGNGDRIQAVTLPVSKFIQAVTPGHVLTFQEPARFRDYVQDMVRLSQ